MATDRESDSATTEGPRTAASIALARGLLVASVAVFILFGVYEVLARTWLSGSDGELLLVLQRVRAAATVLIVAAVAGWLILREGPPLIAAGPLPAENAEERRVDPAEKRLHYARWFILMRWIAIVVAMVAVVTAVDVAALLPARVGPSLLGLVACLMILNLGYSVALRFSGAAPVAFLAVQVYVDLLFLILLLHYSGGIENPLTPLLLLHVIIAGIVLGRLHAYLVAGTASVLFGLLAWGECTGVLPHYMLSIFPHVHVDGIVRHAAHVPLYAASRVALQAVLLLLVAYFTTTLVERIRADERRLEAQADRALAQTQTLERALETTGTALCLCDHELRPFWSNARWTEWVEMAPELRCSVHACDSPATSTLHDGGVRTDEIRGAVAAAPGGTPVGRVFHVTTAPVLDRAGQVSQVVTIARDVTEQHDAQARALRAERLAAVGELAGQVAHEVNNPIAIISAKARLLLGEGRERLPPKATQELIKIAELTDRVARIAQGLLSYCRPAPGARAPLDVVLPVRRALAFVEGRLEAAGVDVRDELPAGLPYIHANAAELEQVFLNILLNALDAMPAGGRLRIHADVEDGSGRERVSQLFVRITDTGHGVPAALVARVFDPFHTTKGRNGSGLGLSICQGLVRSHGGEVELRSEQGRGTCVTVRLPTLAGAAKATAVLHDAHPVHVDRAGTNA